MDKTVRSEQVNVIALVRGEEHFVFVFDPKRRCDCGKVELWVPVLHDGESVTVFCGGVNDFLLFFSNNFYRAIVFIGDFMRQLFQLCGIAPNEIFGK